MVRNPSRLDRVVAPCHAFLPAIPGHHRRVQIQRYPVEGKLAKQPAVEGIHHPLVRRLVELAKQAHHRLEVGHS